ncbi:hypothetical protein R1sor_022024 [Riccia sorocarpa]|uniref:Uncharacterized protein n=1 Tax=Riccia sorocarpa TaxID=122646 RepID=A0ABD3GIP4_9MARC
MEMMKEREAMLEEIITENGLDLPEADDTPIVIPERELTLDKSDEEEQENQPLPPDMPIREKGASGTSDLEVSVATYPDIPVPSFQEVANMASHVVQISEHQIVQAVAQPGQQLDHAPGQEPRQQTGSAPRKEPERHKVLDKAHQKTTAPGESAPGQAAKPNTRSKGPHAVQTEDSKQGELVVEEEGTRPVDQSVLPQEIHSMVKELSQSVRMEEPPVGIKGGSSGEKSQGDQSANDELFDLLYELGPYD